MNRTALAMLGLLGNSLVMSGCGGAKQSPETQTPYGQQQPAASPEPAPADEAGTAEEDSGYEGQRAAPPSAASRPYGAAQSPTSISEPERRDTDAAESNIDGLTEALDRALALATPDCVTGAVLRDQICELSQAICRLAGDKPSDAELQSRCTDGRNRCDRAAHRVRTACPESR